MSARHVYGALLAIVAAAGAHAIHAQDAGGARPEIVEVCGPLALTDDGRVWSLFDAPTDNTVVGDVLLANGRMWALIPGAGRGTYQSLCATWGAP